MLLLVDSNIIKHYIDARNEQSLAGNEELLFYLLLPNQTKIKNRNQIGSSGSFVLIKF